MRQEAETDFNVTAIYQEQRGISSSFSVPNGETAMPFATCRRFVFRADNIFQKTCTILIVIGGALITLTVVLQVLLRYVFKSPLFGLEEFSRLIAVWVYFLGAIFGTKLDSHVQGDVAERFFKSNRSKTFVKTLTWFLSSLLCILFLYHASKYCIWLHGTGERTTGLWWPRITSVGSMFFGAFFMTLYSIGNFVHSVERFLNLSGNPSGGDL
jgi:TRAP-type transport system small permease protein